MEHLQQATPEERTAARWNYGDGVRRYGVAFGAFAEAIGHLKAIREPDLYQRLLVGNWPNMDTFVRDFVIQSGLVEELRTVPERLRPYVAIDPRRVAANLREELLVLEVEDRVWVFDARPVVKTTVEESQREAHSE
jgi:hypothetical protein